ncbi:hypothetical protein KY362_02545, partial [Candidatus Woesearchaeota archaeon]|nr:hypothetical protein [Candidatus Woesearchaeota archaeon]
MPDSTIKRIEASLLGLGANEKFRDELQKLSFIDTILSDRRKFIEDLKAFRTDFVPGIVSGEEFDAFLRRLAAGPARPSAEAGAETPKDTFLTHKNPWESEYRRIAKIVGEDECRTLKCGYAF